MIETTQQIAGPVAAKIGQRLMKLAGAVLIFVALCTAPLIAIGWWRDGEPTINAAGSTGIVAPVYAASNEATTDNDDIGYDSEQQAGDNCLSNDVIPLYRHGQIVGYACVVARY